MLFFAVKSQINEKIVFANNPKRFFILIISLILYVWIMRYVGFIISTLIFLITTMRFMGYEKFIKSIVISIDVTAFVYMFFVKIFEIQLPEATIAFFGVLQ